AIGGGEASTDAAGPRRPRHLAGAALAGNGTPAGVTGQVELGGFDRAASDSDGVGPVRTGHTRGRWSGPADSGDPAADTDGAGLEGNPVNPIQAVAALRWCATQLNERAS